MFWCEDTVFHLSLLCPRMIYPSLLQHCFLNFCKKNSWQLSLSSWLLKYVFFLLKLKDCWVFIFHMSLSAIEYMQWTHICRSISCRHLHSHSRLIFLFPRHLSCFSLFPFCMEVIGYLKKRQMIFGGGLTRKQGCTRKALTCYISFTDIFWFRFNSKFRLIPTWRKSSKLTLWYVYTIFCTDLDCWK